MSHKTYKILLFIVAFLVVTGIVGIATGAIIDALRSSPVPIVNIPVANTNAPSEYYDLGEKAKVVKITSPQPGQLIKSPLTITGEARAWYFEASFPVEVQDANGAVLGFGIAQAQGDWMTDAFVQFKAVLDYTESTTSTGTLILRKDNPSGLPQYDDSVSVPVRFDLTK